MSDSKICFDRTLSHEQASKIVIDLGSSPTSGIHCLAVEKLRKHYGLADKPVRVTEPFQMLGEVDDELGEALGVDVTGIIGPGNMFGFSNLEPLKEFKTHWGQVVLVPEGFNTTSDGKGGTLMYPEGDLTKGASARMPSDSYFFDALIRQEPFDESELDPEDNLLEFGPVDEANLAYWKKASAEARSKGKGVLASLGGTGLGDIALVPGMQLTAPKGIRDVAEWYMSTLVRPDYIHAIFDRQIEIAIENYRRYYEAIGDQIDVVFLCGTDFGTQDSTFCSTAQFDELWLPYYRRINDWIHTHTPWKVFKHSCGAVKEFMPRFIEAGIDIINPVQISAAGMDPLELKREYGKDLVFWGGGIDTQKTLPYGTPAEVSEEVKRLCDIFAPGGGFVFNTVHNIQANVPIENLVAMVETLKKLNG